MTFWPGGRPFSGSACCVCIEFTRNFVLYMSLQWDC